MDASVKSKKKLAELSSRGGDATINDKRALFRSLWMSQTQLPCLQEAIADYDIMRQIGKGTFSNVYYAKYRSNGSAGGGGEASAAERGSAVPQQGVAIKLIDKARVTHSSDVRKVIRNVQRINREIEIMKSCVHDGICRVLHSFQTDLHVFIVLEYAERDLFQFMSAYPQGLPIQLAQYLNRIIALSIRHLHNRKIAHRDIKPENILVTGDLRENNLLVKLCDFGLSLKPELKCADFVGSPGFFAPEILLSTQYDAFAADNWSFGALLLETVCGTPTFEEAWLNSYRSLSDHSLFRELVQGSVDGLRSLDTLGQDPNLFSLVTGILRVDPDQRDTIHTVVINPWLDLVKISEVTGQLEILRLTIDPADEGSPADQVVVDSGNADAKHRRRDALQSFAVEEAQRQDAARRGRDQAYLASSSASKRNTTLRTRSDHHSQASNGTSGFSSSYESARSRSHSMTTVSCHPHTKNDEAGPDSIEDYTLPPMTICHLDDSGVVRQVVQASLSMAFPNHRLVNFATSTHLIHTIMASQEEQVDPASEIKICILDENIGEQLKGSDLAKMLIKLGYKGMLLCMTALDELDDIKLVYDGVVSKQVGTRVLKAKLIESWRKKFGESSLVPVTKLSPDTGETTFDDLRVKCLEQMMQHPKEKLKFLELFEMKGDFESVKCSQKLLDVARDLLQKTRPEEFVPFSQESVLYKAIREELATLQIARSSTTCL